MYYEYLNEEDENEDDVSSLIREKFWAKIRSNVYKKVCRGIGGYTQWAYIVGRKTYDNCGNRITLTDKNKRILQEIVDYLNSTEGRNELLDMSIIEVPDHVDTLISYIQDAKKIEEVKVDEFRLYLKHKDKILKFLSRL
jgi:hypothetical protein